MAGTYHTKPLNANLACLKSPEHHGVYVHVLRRYDECRPARDQEKWRPVFRPIARQIKKTITSTGLQIDTI